MHALPAPKTTGNVSVEQAIHGRRSVREFAPTRLSVETVSQLLWAAQGVTDRHRGLRAAPSAGATYPLVIYLVSDEGVYLYHPESHTLTSKRPGDVRSILASSCLGQPWVREAPVSLVLAAVYERTTKRYGPRGERYVHIEVGHAAENIHLQAVALGLGSVPIGAFDDRRVAEILGLPAKERPLYIIPVGVPR